eukprot:6146264-Prymnesium_polylepis.3
MWHTATWARTVCRSHLRDSSEERAGSRFVMGGAMLHRPPFQRFGAHGVDDEGVFDGRLRRGLVIVGGERDMAVGTIEVLSLDCALYIGFRRPDQLLEAAEESLHAAESESERSVLLKLGVERFGHRCMRRRSTFGRVGTSCAARGRLPPRRRPGHRWLGHRWVGHRWQARLPVSPKRSPLIPPPPDSPQRRVARPVHGATP